MKITALKDHQIYQECEGSVTNIIFIKGEEIEVDEKWISTLIAEGVIAEKQTKKTLKTETKGE